MKINNNQRGFTLVELLAVIVILAVLALVAMPNVTKLMDSSRKNAFITEAENFANYAKQSYTQSQITGLTDTNSTADESIIRGVTLNSKVYDYYCITYAQMVKAGLIEKSNGENYGGVYEIFMPTDGGVSTTVVYMKNGNYFINGLSLDVLAKGEKAYTTETGSNEFKFNNSSASSLSRTQCYLKKDATALATHVSNLNKAGQFN